MLEFRPMSDPLSIPDDKKVGSARREHSCSFWIGVAVLVILNGWFDYYHPLGILFDIIIVIIWAARS